MKPKIRKPAYESFSQSWLIESWLDRPEFSCRKMFGGLAIYWEGRHVLFFAENPGDREWAQKKLKFDFDLWNGILLPTSREHHQSLQKQFPSLIAHPILGKWLYLKLDEPDYEVCASRLIKLIRQGDPRFGIEPGKKSLKKSKASK